LLDILTSWLALLDRMFVRAALLASAARTSQTQRDNTSAPPIHGFHSRMPVGACADAWRSCWRRRLTPPRRQHRHAIMGLRTSLSACLSLPRARVHVAGYRKFFVPSHHSDWRMVLGAGSGETTSSLRSSTG